MWERTVMLMGILGAYYGRDGNGDSPLLLIPSPCNIASQSMKVLWTSAIMSAISRWPRATAVSQSVTISSSRVRGSATVT